MKGRYGVTLVLMLSMALATAIGMASTVSAQDGKGAPGKRLGPGGKQVVLHGVIAAVENDRFILRQADGVEVPIALDANTRIAPPGVEPQIGMKAQVVARKPATEGDPLVAVAVVLVDRPESPGEPRLGPPVHGCGSIVALPEAAEPPATSWVGEWTIRVPDVADYVLKVTEATRISPPDAVPELGGRACFTARQTEEGLVAQNIELTGRSQADCRRDGQRCLVVLRGTVVTLPEDRSTFPWVLELAVAGGANQQITVTEATQIRGELALQAVVTVRAMRDVAEDGTVTLVAQQICVAGERCRTELPL